MTVTKDTSNHKRDMMMCYLWQRGTDSIHDMRVVKTDNLSQKNKSLEKCLLMLEKEKNCKHLEACLCQRNHF